MSKSLEIKQIIKKNDKANNEIKALKKKINSEMYSVRSWWKGSASESFLNKYKEIDNDILALTRKIDDLRYHANKLMRLLEEEERERKSIAKKIKQ